MTQQPQYVALRALRFGTEELRPGDPVPVETGRNYALMLRLGQIGQADAPAPAAPQEETLLSPYDKGETVYFVADDGTYTAVVFQAAQAATDELRVEMELPEGAIIAEVAFPDETDTVYVALGSLLPAQPTGTLIEALSLEAATRPESVQAQTITALEGRVGFLELLLSAIRTEGAALTDGFPSLKELRGNGLTTLEGLRVLTAGEGGRANLIGLDKIGEKSADKILAALAEPTLPPAPEG